MNNDMQMQGNPPMDYPLPVAPGPLDPGRPDVPPRPEDGVEQVPDHEGERPLDDDDAGVDPGRVRDEPQVDQEQDPR